MKAKILKVVLRKLPSGKWPATALEDQLNQFLAEHPAGTNTLRNADRQQPLHFSSLAFIEMLACKDRETRQLVLARTVASMNLP
jgi:hypothetical protein